MYHYSSPVKPLFCVDLKLHFDLDECCNIRNEEEMRIHNVAFNMNENNDSFNFMGVQLDFLIHFI